MRRLMIAGVAAALIAGPFSASALAQEEDPPLSEPVRDVLCTVVRKLGFVYVERCFE